MKQKIVAGILAVTMLSTLMTGCGSSSSEEEVMITPNEPMSSGLKWINSSIDGAIDDTTDVRLEDDFYTAVNKDWLLSTTVSEESYRKLNVLGSSLDTVTDRLVSIMSGENDPDATGNIDIPQEDLEHIQSLVQTFAAAAGDWDQRNSESAASLKKYLQYIDEIDSVDDMKNYFLDNDGQNLLAIELIPFAVERSTKDILSAENDTKIQYVTVTSSTPLSMQTLQPGADVTSIYTGQISDVINTESTLYNNLNENFSAVMTKIGYSQAESDALLKKCLKFECGLVDHEADSTTYSSEWEGDDPVSREQLEAMEGNYPLTELLDAYGYDTDEIIVENPSYVKYIGSIMKEDKLDDIKAWLTVNTVLNSMELLDWETHEIYVGADEEEEEDENQDTSSTDSTGETPETEVESEDTPVQLQIENVQTYLGSCLDTVYVSRYCTAEEKEDITEMIGEIIDQYRQMIQEEDWMSDETKEQAIAKLDNLGINVLYPSVFESYDYLDFGDDTDLLDLVADISMQSRGSDADQVGKATTNDTFPGMSTTQVNACYSPSDNSINILAGYIAGDTYDYSMSEEEKLALLGTVIGHEISHGFDNGGAQWDKDGRYLNWWTPTDKLAFTQKVLTLQAYYSSITPYPGGQALTGTNMSQEAIADMAGMKVVLRIAAQKEDFDYKTFFENYAALFSEKDTFNIASQLATGDPHPLGCLRCNITLSQFEEFRDTYGIREGDGMYTAPEDNILVW